MIDKRNPNYYTKANALRMVYNNKYFVKIPRIYTYSEDEKKYYGIPVDVVNGDVKKNSVFDLADSYLPIYTLAKAVSEDRTVLIKNVNDIPEIIKITADAIGILNNIPNIEQVDEETIMILNMFLDKLLEENGEYAAKLESKNDKLNNYVKQSFGGFMKHRAPAVTDVRNTVNTSHGTIDKNTTVEKKLKRFGIDFSKIEAR